MKRTRRSASRRNTLRWMRTSPQHLPAVMGRGGGRSSGFRFIPSVSDGWLSSSCLSSMMYSSPPVLFNDGPLDGQHQNRPPVLADRPRNLGMILTQHHRVVRHALWRQWAGGHFIFWAEKFWTTPSQKSSAMSSQTLVKVVDLGWGISLAVR